MNSQEILTIKDILVYLNRFKYLIIFVLMLSLAFTYWLTKKQTKIYSASVSLIINFRESTPVEEISERYYTSFQEYDAFYNTEYERIRSYGLAKEIVERYKLNENPYFENLVKNDGDVASALQSMLTLTPLEESNKVMLNIEGTDPDIVALFANYYAESYKDYNLRRKTEHLKKSISWLEERVSEADERVINAEKNLFDFKFKNRVILTTSEDNRNTTIQKLYSLEEKYNEFRVQRIDAEQEYNYYLKKDKKDNSYLFKDSSYINLQTSLLVKRNELSTTLEKYEENHPKILSLKEQIKNIETKIEAIEEQYKKSIESRYKIILAKEKEVLTLKEKAIIDALKIEENELIYKQNKRTANTETEIYKMLLSELKKNNLKLLLQTNNIEILDYAKIPMAPIKPKLKLNLVLGFFAGGVLSFLLILLLLYLDKTVKTRDELETTYGLTFLGHLPKDVKIEAPKIPYKELYSINAPRSSFAENCRSIITNIDFMNQSESEKINKTFLVTSPGPMEGKTTIASNLASTLADQGLKTVVIDTDLRKPRLHKVFFNDNKVGLTSFVSGGMDLDSIIQKTELQNLDFISAGPIPPNAIQIIKSKKFKELMDLLSERYDRVIFDSPPTSAVSDPMVLSKMLDGVVLVVKYNTTNKHYLREAVTQFNGIQSKVIGVILNQADPSKISYYSYKKYHYYYYGK
ncbi:polysaccharide biosynthesis tyrosine autokinase [bacterium]|nr:polysaccharide biosynthesis tyrosine autokinase [bacterium]